LFLLSCASTMAWSHHGRHTCYAPYIIIVDKYAQ
jgi:hypothetical protein